MIDSHCHLNFPAIKADIKNVIKRSKASGITKLLTINTNPNEFDDHFNLIKEYENIYIAYGIHPEEVKDNSYLSLDDIEDKFDSLSLEDLKEKLDKVWDKIKMSRKRGLEEGEFGVGNLVFKLLRRNGYIGKVIGMKRKLYIKQFS
mgnify:CR=1 FL=1